MATTDYGTLVDHFTIPQGADWGRRWPVTDANGNPVDVTGWSVRAQVRPSRAESTVLYEWSTDAGTATADTNGVTIDASAGTSQAWTWTVGEYDVLLTDTGGTVSRIVEGHVRVSGDVTRD